MRDQIPEDNPVLSATVNDEPSMHMAEADAKQQAQATDPGQGQAAEAEQSLAAEQAPADPETGTETEAEEQSFDPAEYDLTLPEDVAVDPLILAEFRSLAAELRLSPENARRLVDLEVKSLRAATEQARERASAWRREIEADSEFGGQRLQETVRRAGKALSTYDPAGTLLQELDSAGYGNHPGIIRFLARVGAELEEDQVLTGRENQTTRTIPLRDRLWPDM